MARKVGIYYAFWTHEWEADFLPFVGKVKGLGFDQLEVGGIGLMKATAAARQELAGRGARRRRDALLRHRPPHRPRRVVGGRGGAPGRRGVHARAHRRHRRHGRRHALRHGARTWPATLPKGFDDKRPFRDQSLRSMRELVKVAEDRGVVLLVEVINRFEQFLVNTAAEAVAYVDEVASPGCRILLDTFHMNIEEDSIGGAIRLAGPRLGQLHLGETNRKPPGLGRMPWGEIRAALDDIRFEGSLVMEPFVLPGGQVARDIGVWRRIIENPDLDRLAGDAQKFVRGHLV